MTIGILQVELILDSAQSLKEKRMVLKSLKDRIRKHFNVSIAELNYQGLWQRAGLGIVNIGQDRRAINSILSKITELLKNTSSIEIIKSKMELI